MEQIQTWVGPFYDSRKSPKWTVEHFEQTMSGIVAKGWATNDDGTRYANWVSETVSIDPRKGILQYTYDCDVILKNTRQQGIGAFTVTKRGWFNAPKAMSGYSADLTDGERTENNEFKVSNSLLELEDALQRVREKLK